MKIERNGRLRITVGWVFLRGRGYPRTHQALFQTEVSSKIPEPHKFTPDAGGAQNWLHPPCQPSHATEPHLWVQNDALPLSPTRV